jgi:LCP family protein required for cell wall assembly
MPAGPRHRAVPAKNRSGWFGVFRVCLAVASAFAVAIAGFGWWTAHGLVGGITVSQALGADAPRSAGGAMNILLMGLDTRKDQQGNDLPSAILDKLHAGDSESGGYNTNTLILVHIGRDDRVTAFSIPRDDYIGATGIPGYHHIKIKEAYGLTKANTEQKMTDSGVSDRAQLENAGREAGRAATLAAVRNLTGAPIDYFAEVSLAGFYDLAESLGGVAVCLNHAVHDDYSGADFAAGRQTLDPEQALAFVRQRHGLDNGDLDRTHRQQAFLVSVMHQLQAAGAFNDVGKLNALMAVARKDIVVSTGWGEDQFRRIGALATGNVEYRTLPVLRYETTTDGQEVNIVDPAAIKAQVAAAFNDGSSTSTEMRPASSVDIVNTGVGAGLAGTVSRQLGRQGFTAGQIRNAGAGESTTTAVEYGAGADADAQHVAALLGIGSTPRAGADVAPGHVRVTLGPDYELPDTLWQTGSRSTTSVPAPDSGRPIDGGAIPCVN